MQAGRGAEHRMGCSHTCEYQTNTGGISQVPTEELGVPAPLGLSDPSFLCQEEKSTKLLAVKTSGVCG